MHRVSTVRTVPGIFGRHTVSGVARQGIHIHRKLNELMK
jgi:hypothetical protein